MRVLLLSMPDSFEHTPAVAMRMPNGALASLAGNVDRAPSRRDRRSRSSCRRTVRPTVERLMRDLDPDVVGLSVMTFQRRDRAARSSALIRALKPRRAIVVGGYDPSLAPEAYEDPSLGRRLHRPRRRRAHVPRAAARARARRRRVDAHRRACRIARRRPASRTTRPRRSARWTTATICAAEPRRARARRATRLLGRPIDVVETSRGCTYDCSFCSIIEMRGRNFHTFGYRARARRHRRRARARRARDLPRRRQHHAERRAVRGAVPRDHRRRASTTSTTSCRR